VLTKFLDSRLRGNDKQKTGMTDKKACVTGSYKIVIPGEAKRRPGI
jgi:hypothetical protein